MAVSVLCCHGQGGPSLEHKGRMRLGADRLADTSTLRFLTTKPSGAVGRHEGQVETMLAKYYDVKEEWEQQCEQVCVMFCEFCDMAGRIRPKLKMVITDSR